MSSMKKRISGFLGLVATMALFVMLILFVFLQIRAVHDSARANAEDIFYQVEQLLADNQADIERFQREYNASVLRRADNAVTLLNAFPDSAGDPDGLQRIARLIEVDELHVFDDAGAVVASTRPEAVGDSLGSEDRLSFFRTMLSGKALRMVKRIASGEASMQYGCVWAPDGSRIVLVGLRPEGILRGAEHNELSYIFSLLRPSRGAQLLAADRVTGEIEGATDPSLPGKTLRDIGIETKDALLYADGYYDTVNGVPALCLFTTIGDSLVGYVVSNQALAGSVMTNSIMLILGLALAVTLMMVAVNWYLDRHVVRSVRQMNETLSEISAGNLDVPVKAGDTLELSDLSDHINGMVTSLMDSTRKMSYVLNRAQLNIGVYEYNLHSKRVRFTERVPDLLDMDEGRAGQQTIPRATFDGYLDALKRRPVPGEAGVYSLSARGRQRFVKLEEIAEDSEITGILVDVTEDVLLRRAIESERDVDALTGLLNRRGLDSALNRVFGDDQAVAHSAIVMIDADGLKAINDSLGHWVGDLYIQGIARLLSRFSAECRGHCVTSRNGGDEYVLFLYGYDTEQTLLTDIDRLRALQDSEEIPLGDGRCATLRFSLGYSLRTDETSYHGDLFQLADTRMYEDKRARKAERRD